MKAKVVKLIGSLMLKSNKEESEVERIRKEAQIEKLCVATVIGNGSPVTRGYGDLAVDKETIFGAASLSKPVFAYLVLKLIEKGKFSLDRKRLNDILPFKDFCQQHGFTWENNAESIARINALTPGMILSHKTGLDLNRKDEVNHQFEPGQEYYRYSGLPLFYLQKVIEKLHEPHTTNLEMLAKKYVFEPLGMKNSSFGENPCAANSLTTSAEDYVLFVQAWMSDEKLQYAFNPQICMKQDPWAKEMVSDQSDLNYVAECLGFQLELDEQGKPLTAFKTGDMGEWRGWVAIDLTGNLQDRKATVYFAKGPDHDGNGHIFAETLIKPYFQIEHGLRWFKEKYGFATGWENNWQALQNERCNRGMHYQEQSPKMPQPVLDSTEMMFKMMPPQQQELALKTSKSQEQEVEQRKNDDKMQENINLIDREEKSTTCSVFTS